jgi:hypothetical protein
VGEEEEDSVEVDSVVDSKERVATRTARKEMKFPRRERS